MGQRSGPHPHQVSTLNQVWELELHGERRQWVTEMNTFPLRPPLRLPLPNLLFASLAFHINQAWPGEAGLSGCVFEMLLVLMAVRALGGHSLKYH